MKYWIDSRPLTGPQWCGDFVDCIPLSTYRHAVIAGEVAGHGTAARDGAIALHRHIRTQVCRQAPLTTGMRGACDAFTRIIIKEATPFASLFVAVVDLENRVMRYASAGHEPGLLFRGDGTHEHLDPTGPLLGTETVPVFGDRVLDLNEESLLVVVTDGITEARMRHPDQTAPFGTRGVVEAVRTALRHRRDPAREVCSAALQYAGGVLADNGSVVISSLSPPTVFATTAAARPVKLRR